MDGNTRFGVLATVLSCCLSVAAGERAAARDNQPSPSAPSPKTNQSDASRVHKSAAKTYDIRSTKWLMGDWGGLRTDLEDQGVRFRVDLMNQILANMHGGRETKNGVDTAGSYEFNLYLDLGKMNLIDDAEFWLRGKGTWGGDDSDFDKEKIGALFKTNQDASTEEPIFVDKWHYRQFLFDRKVEFRIGRMEPVKDLFDTSKIIGHEDRYFLNRALVRNATIPPDKGLGLFVRWNFAEDAYVSAAVLDANAKDRQTNFNTAFHDDDQFRFYAELGCKPKPASSKGELPGHYRIGTWYDPKDKKSFSTPSAVPAPSTSKAGTGDFSSAWTRWSGKRTTIQETNRGSR